MANTANRDDRIRDRAYGIWESEGRLDGHHERHWHQASREVEEAGDADEAAGVSPGGGELPAGEAGSGDAAPEEAGGTGAALSGRTAGPP